MLPESRLYSIQRLANAFERYRSIEAVASGLGLNPNSRRVRRRIIQDALAARIELRHVTSRPNGSKSGSSIRTALYWHYAMSAKRRGLRFELTKDELAVITSQRCFYCERQPSQVFRYRGEVVHYSGIDRLDNSLGYTWLNSRAACRSCNTAKHAVTMGIARRMIEAAERKESPYQHPTR
jgi:hypothetical protein